MPAPISDPLITPVGRGDIFLKERSPRTERAYARIKFTMDDIMNYCTKTFLSIILCLLLSNSVIAQETISLKTAIQTALNRNSSVVKSNNSLGTYSVNLKSAYGNLLPNLNVSGGWNWQRVSNNQGTTQIDYLGNAQDVSQSETDSRNYNLSIGGNVTLFDGLSSFRQIDQKKNELRGAQFDFEKLRQNTILATVQLFIAVANSEKLLQFQEEDLKYNQDMLAKIKEMQNIKSATKIDVYAQEYQTANSKLAWIQAKNTNEKAKISLLTYLSMDVTKDYAFPLDSIQIPEPNNELSNLDSLYPSALNTRADFQSQRLKLENGELQLKISKSNLYPSLTGNYSLSTSAIQPKDLFSRKVYGVGLSLNVPVFSRWSTETSIETAQIQIQNANEELKALRLQIIGEIKSAAVDLNTAKLQREVSQSSLLYAKETWEMRKEKYTVGSATYVEQQQSYRDYIQAVNNSIIAESNYLQQQFSFLNTLGMLNPENYYLNNQR